MEAEYPNVFGDAALIVLHLYMYGRTPLIISSIETCVKTRVLKKFSLMNWIV